MIPKQFILKFWNFWPPFFGAGIRIAKVSDDYRYAKVELKRRPWNQNYVGTQFGGSMFAMTDAMYVVMLINNLGRDYIVWDKAATIKYLKPGKSKLTAEFRLSEDQIRELKEATDREGKINHDFNVSIFDTDGTHIAEVIKTIHIRKKR